MKINGLINEKINPLMPGEKGEKLPGHESSIVAVLCLLHYLETDQEKAPGDQEWSHMKHTLMCSEINPHPLGRAVPHSC